MIDHAVADAGDASTDFTRKRISSIIDLGTSELYEAELVSPPRIVQRIVFRALAPLARARGYKAINPEYLGPTGKAAARPDG